MRTGNGLIRHDKVHCCLYCDKLLTNIWRHYEVQHKDESDVIAALSHARKSKEFAKATDRIRLLGDYHHNVQVLCTKSGQLIVVRRPAGLADGSDFLPCRHCKGFFLRTELWRHVKACTFRDDSAPSSDSSVQKDSKMLLMPIIYSHMNIGSSFSVVLSSLSNDSISLVVKHDWLILTFGNLLSSSHDQTKAGYICQRMRQLARLVIQLRSTSENQDADLGSFLKPTLFDMVLEAVHAVCKYTESDSTIAARITIPSLALKLGHSVKKCCTLLVGKALRERNALLEQDAEAFAKLFNNEWTERVSSIALRTLHDDKRNVPNLLPLTEDLVKMKDYLEKRLATLCEMRSSVPVDDAHSLGKIFSELVDVIMCRIILFNKRRSGEVSKVKLDTYSNRPQWSDQTSLELVSVLTASERELCRRMQLMEICGKRNQTVPMLLTPDVVDGLDILVSLRHEVGIIHENPYLFPRFGSLKYADACVSMRSVTQKACLQKPELVRSTKLRKYIATVSQVLDMTTGELNLLCKHMGHSLKVHENYYKLPSHTLELSKISKLLLATEQSDMSAFVGKSLAELEIPDDVCVNEGSDGESVESDSYERNDNPLSTDYPGTDDLCALDTSTSSGVAEKMVVAQKRQQKTRTKNAKRIRKEHEPLGKDLSSAHAETLNLSRKIQQKTCANAKSIGEDESLCQSSTSTVAAERRLIAHSQAQNLSVEQLESPFDEPKMKLSNKVCRWSADEKRVIFEQLGDYIKRNVTPGQKACLTAAQNSCGVLKDRSWKSIKYCVKNIIQSKRRI